MGTIGSWSSYPGEWLTNDTPIIESSVPAPLSPFQVDDLLRETLPSNHLIDFIKTFEKCMPYLDTENPRVEEFMNRWKENISAAGHQEQSIESFKVLFSSSQKNYDFSEFPAIFYDRKKVEAERKWYERWVDTFMYRIMDICENPKRTVDLLERCCFFMKREDFRNFFSAWVKKLIDFDLEEDAIRNEKYLMELLGIMDGLNKSGGKGLLWITERSKIPNLDGPIAELTRHYVTISDKSPQSICMKLEKALMNFDLRNISPCILAAVKRSHRQLLSWMIFCKENDSLRLLFDLKRIFSNYLSKIDLKYTAVDDETFFRAFEIGLDTNFYLFSDQIKILFLCYFRRFSESSVSVKDKYINNWLNMLYYCIERYDAMVLAREILRIGLKDDFLIESYAKDLAFRIIETRSELQFIKTFAFFFTLSNFSDPLKPFLDLYLEKLKQNPGEVKYVYRDILSKLFPVNHPFLKELNFLAAAFAFNQKLEKREEQFYL